MKGMTSRWYLLAMAVFLAASFILPKPGSSFVLFASMAIIIAVNARDIGARLAHLPKHERTVAMVDLLFIICAAMVAGGIAIDIGHVMRGEIDP
jgi:hypothetical protein